MKVREVFVSIQGESSSAGLPTVFVRFAGCNLRCRYCDTTYAYEGGEQISPAELVSRISRWPFRRVCLTGGEPLLQPQEEIQQLLDTLSGWEVSVETNGSLALEPFTLHPGQRWVMDVKCPGSGEEAANRWENLRRLSPEDEVKFVLSDREDYLWACRVIREWDLARRVRVLMSPVWNRLDPQDLADWILDDGLDVRLQLQLHKIIFKGRGEGRNI